MKISKNLNSLTSDNASNEQHSSAVTSSAPNTLGNYYCKTMYNSSTVQSKTIEVYKRNKKGKLVLKSKKVITTSNIHYPATNFNYEGLTHIATSSTTTPENTNEVATSNVYFYPNGANVSCTCEGCGCNDIAKE